MEHLSFILTISVMIFAYLVGSTMSAIWIAKLLKLPDPRSYGSMNPGATNMARSNHKLAAISTFLLDILKGTIITCLALKLGFSLQLAHLCGSCAVLGHIFPLYHDFVGGKGAATYFGVIVTLDSLCGGIAFLLWSSSLALFRNSGYSALITSCATPVIVLMNPATSHLFLAVLLVNILIIACHAKNLAQLSLQLQKQFNASI